MNALFQTVSQLSYDTLTHIWDLKQMCSTRGSRCSALTCERDIWDVLPYPAYHKFLLFEIKKIKSWGLDVIQTIRGESRRIQFLDIASSSATPCSNENETFSTQNHRKRHRHSTSIYKNKFMHKCSCRKVGNHRSISNEDDCYDTSDVQIDTVQLPTSYSQRLNSGKPLGTGGCEWLWVFASCSSEPIPTTQLPILFVVLVLLTLSVIKSNYKIFKEITFKKRLNILYTEVKNKIREELRVAPIVHFKWYPFAHVQLTTNHSQRLNSGKPLGTSCCGQSQREQTGRSRVFLTAGYH